MPQAPPLAAGMITSVTPRKIERMVESMQHQVAEKIVELRKSHGLTQLQLSELAGIDRKTINRIENGHFSPSIDTLTRLALALQVSIHDLLGS
jgi:DNA-binding XRE family transcriptional regulator